MLKTFYVQTNEESMITDIIQMPHDDYVEVSLNTPLPSRIMCGCYRLIDGNIFYIKEKDVDLYELMQQNLLLKTELTDTQVALAEIYETMLGGTV